MRRTSQLAILVSLSVALTCVDAFAGPRGRGGARGGPRPGMGAIQPSHQPAIGTLQRGPSGIGTLQQNQNQARIGTLKSGGQPNIGVLQGNQPSIGVLQGNQAKIGTLKAGGQPNIGVLQGNQPNIGVLQNQNRNRSPGIGVLQPSRGPSAVHAPPRQPGAANRPGNVQSFMGNLSGQRQNQIQSLRSGPPPFSPAWYKAHPNAWKATHPYARPRPGVWATAAVVAGWVGLNTQPVVYDYGSYGTSVVYSDAATLSRHEQRLTQLEQLVAAGATSNAQGQWNQIGVYSLLPPDQTSSTVAIQLAVDASGHLRGNYVDLLSNTIQPLVGGIDLTAQWAAWQVESNPAVVYETGLGNLTQPTTAVLLHFGEDQTQRWTMVRQKSE